MGSFKIKNGMNLALTQAEIDVLPLTAGVIVYNTTTSKIQVCDGTQWNDKN